MGIGTKALRYLEEKKRRLELQTVGAAKVIDEIPPSIRAELRRVSTKRVTQLTVTEYQLLIAFCEMVRAQAEAKYELAEIDSVLRLGRAKGSRNRQPRAPDPAIALALLEWEVYASSNPGLSERTLAGKLAFKHCPVPTVNARKKFAENLRSRKRSSKKARYRRMAEAIA